jgi:hypothetical protein
MLMCSALALMGCQPREDRLLNVGPFANGMPPATRYIGTGSADHCIAEAIAQARADKVSVARGACYDSRGNAFMMFATTQSQLERCWEPARGTGLEPLNCSPAIIRRWAGRTPG